MSSSCGEGVCSYPMSHVCDLSHVGRGVSSYHDLFMGGCIVQMIICFFQVPVRCHCRIHDQKSGRGSQILSVSYFFSALLPSIWPARDGRCILPTGGRQSLIGDHGGMAYASGKVGFPDVAGPWVMAVGMVQLRGSYMIQNAG